MRNSRRYISGGPGGPGGPGDFTDRLSLSVHYASTPALNGAPNGGRGNNASGSNSVESNSVNSDDLCSDVNSSNYHSSNSSAYSSASSAGLHQRPGYGPPMQRLASVSSSRLYHQQPMVLPPQQGGQGSATLPHRPQSMHYDAGYYDRGNPYGRHQYDSRGQQQQQIYQHHSVQIQPGPPQIQRYGSSVSTSGGSGGHYMPNSSVSSAVSSSGSVSSSNQVRVHVRNPQQQLKSPNNNNSANSSDPLRINSNNKNKNNNSPAGGGKTYLIDCHSNNF